MIPSDHMKQMSQTTSLTH